MKTLEWQQFFTTQRDDHGKVIFSVAELANVARTTPHVLNTELSRLVSRGIITRYAQGRYGLTHGVTLEQLLPAIDPGAYITGFYALFQYHLVTQAPSEITCFTNRRHHRTSLRFSNTWKMRFLRVPPPLYAKPAKGVVAPAEQAFCDFVYLNLREGIDPQHLVTFRNLDRVNLRRLEKTLRPYSEPIRKCVEQILLAFQPKATRLGSGL